MPRECENMVEAVIIKTVHETLERLGIDHKNPHEIQKDFAFVRTLRDGADSVREKAITTLVGSIVTAIIGAITYVALTFKSPHN